MVFGLMDWFAANYLATPVDCNARARKDMGKPIVSSQPTTNQPPRAISVDLTIFSYGVIDNL